jgi:hypothetical protein
MPTYEYKVVPFIGQVKAGEKGAPQKVAGQLEELLNLYTASGRGWEFYRVDRITIAAQPGCLASWLGQTAITYGFDQVIFRREISAPDT